MFDNFYLIASLLNDKTKRQHNETNEFVNFTGERFILNWIRIWFSLIDFCDLTHLT